MLLVQVKLKTTCQSKPWRMCLNSNSFRSSQPTVCLPWRYGKELLKIMNLWMVKKIENLHLKAVCLQGSMVRNSSKWQIDYWCKELELFILKRRSCLTTLLLGWWYLSPLHADTEAVRFSPGGIQWFISCEVNALVFLGGSTLCFRIP